MSENQAAKEPKDLRLRNQLFPNAEKRIFSTTEKGFVPIPIVYRKLLRYLSPPQARLLLYLQLRASRYGICYPTLEEITHDLGLSSRKKLTPHLKALEERKFILSKTLAGKRFFLLLHPRLAVRHMLRNNAMNDDELFEINELLNDLKQKAISRPLTKTETEVA